jgi:aconitase A
VTWLDSLMLWINGLNPLDFMVYVVSPPLLVAAAVASYVQWREDHSPRQTGHPAE